MAKFPVVRVVKLSGQISCLGGRYVSSSLSEIKDTRPKSQIVTNGKQGNVCLTHSGIERDLN